MVYADGQPVPYEGNLNVKLDLSKYRGKGYKVLVYRNNQIEELEIDKQMIASKDVEEMVPFAAGHRLSSIKSLDVYIKPEDYTAYYVINGKVTGKVWM